MTPRPHRPPLLAQWLLRRVLGRHDRTFILGDLDEEFGRRSEVSVAKARRWYWGQVAGCVQPGARRRWASWRRRRAARTPLFERGARSTLEALSGDARHAVRTLRSQPTWTLAAIVTLGLAIGGTTAMYTIVETVLIRPLSFPDADRLVTVGARGSTSSTLITRVSFPVFEQIQQLHGAFEQVGAYAPSRAILETEDGSELVGSAFFSSGAFSALGVVPAEGRVFVAADDEPGAEPVVIVSHRFWQERLGGDADVIGTMLRVDRQPHAIVGVMEPGFLFPEADVEVWLPLSAIQRDLYSWFLSTVGRLEGRTTFEQLGARLAGLEMTAGDGTNPDFTFTPVPGTLHEHIVGDIGRPLVLFLASMGIVLFIATINVTNLMLSRAAGRSRERAVRQALGAGRARLVQASIVESLTLSIAGGVLGLLLAGWITNAILSLRAEEIPRQAEIGSSATVFVFALGLSFLVGSIVGLIPEIRTSRETRDGLKTSTSALATRDQRRLRSTLIVGQVAVATVLLFGAGLLLRSLNGLLALERGIDIDALVAVRTYVPPSSYPDPGAKKAFYDALEQRLAASVAVTRVSWADNPPYDAFVTSFLEVPGQPRDDRPAAQVLTVSPGFFSTAGIRLLQGESFVAGAGGGMVVNETLARQLWPDRSPLGRLLIVGSREPARVVGVVADTRFSRLSESAPAQVYLPNAGSNRQMVAFVRTLPGGEAVVREIVEEFVREYDREIVVLDARTGVERFRGLVAEPRFRATLIGSLGLLALLLTALGVYGVTAYGISRREREFGIRKALGARRGSIVVRLVLDATSRVLLGLGLGAAGCWWAARFFDSYVFGVESRDPETFVFVVITVLASAVAATLLPARRAARINPVLALRAD